MLSRSRWLYRHLRNCSAFTPTCPPVPPDVAKALQYGEPPPPGLSTDERHAHDQLDFFYKHGLGYALEMANRPQTLYAIADSPVGLAAWILNHDARSYALMARVFDGNPEGITRDDVLDNITLYWLTNTAISSDLLWVKSGRLIRQDHEIRQRPVVLDRLRQFAQRRCPQHRADRRPEAA